MIRKSSRQKSRKRANAFAAAGASILLVSSISYADIEKDYNDYYVPEGDNVFAQDLTDDDGVTLRKYDAGNLVLSGSNTYTGSTEVYGGTLYLTGSDSTISQTQTFLVKEGVGYLSSGATMTSGSGRIGVDEGDSGSVYVTGTGSKWTNSNMISIGESGTGALQVSDGASVVSSKAVSLGTKTGGYGGLWVLEGTWQSNNLLIGLEGEGDVYIWNGGQVTVSGTFLALGTTQTGSGYLQISGSDSVLTATAATRIGVEGVGSYEVLDGATVISGVVEIGSEVGANGTLRVDGTGSSYTMVSGRLRVGTSGTGALQVMNGATFSAFSSITLGGSASAVGSLLVQGSGSILTGTAAFTVGDGGEGSVDIRDGGRVTTSGSTVIASVAGSKGTVKISGSGSKWVDSGSFTIGKGVADIHITDGARLEARQFIVDGGVDLVNGEDPVNITVSGSDSTLWASETFTHEEGRGTFSLVDGGAIRVDGSGVGDGTINVNGGTFTVVVGGTGEISSAGSILAKEIRVNEGVFWLNFQHTDDDYTFSTNIIDGPDVGTGGTLIQAFAGITTLTGSSSIVGAHTASGGELFVSGTAAHLDVKHLGVSQGVFGVTDGARVIAESSRVGDDAPSVIWLSGSGSRLDTPDFRMEGKSEVWIDNRAYLVTSGSAFVGLNATGIDSVVVVSGSNSYWVAQMEAVSFGDVTITDGHGTTDYQGQGNLIVREGGILRVDYLGYGMGSVILSGSERSNIVFGGLPTDEAVATGDVHALIIKSGSSGGGRIILNHTNDNFLFYPQLLGDIEVNHYAGRTILNASNEHTADTIIYGGTMVSGLEGALSENSFLKIIGASAVFDLNGFNESAASVLINEGGSLINGSLDIDSDAILFDGTLSAVLSGSVGAYKFGDGTVTVEGDQLLEGPTRVYQGTLDLVGSIANDGEVYGGNLIVSGTVGGDLSVSGGSAAVKGIVEGSVTVSGNGVVSGDGFIAQNLFNAGIVSPGNSPGALSVGGNYSQSSSGTLQIEIASRTSYDRLLVGGTASLDGTLRIVLSGRLESGDQYEIITAGGGVVGEFSEIDGGNTLRGFEATYLSNSVVIEYTEESFESFTKAKNLSPNVRSVAKALDRANAKGKLGGLLDTLYSTDLSQLPDTLSLLSPEDFAQLYRIGFATAQVQFVNLERRLSDVRNGAIGFSANGMALSNSRGSLNYDGLPIMNDRDGLSLAGFDGKTTCIFPIEQSRWGFFATGVGEWADVESTGNSRGSEFSTGGFTIGADYRVSDSFVVGIAGGYAHTGSDLNNGGSIGVNSGRGTAYASWFTGGAYLNAAIGGAYNSYETKRGTLGGKARGDTNGGEFDALIGGGYDWRVGGFSIGPIASLQYTYIGVSGFQETGSSAPLNFASQSQDSLKSLLGLKASYAWNVGGIVITPEVRAQWSHEYLDSTVAVESGFVGGAGVFTVSSPNIGRDGLLLDAGASVQFSPAVSVFAYYTGDLGRTNYSSNAVNGGFRISF